MTIKVSLKIEKEAGNRGDSSLFIFRPAQTSGQPIIVDFMPSKGKLLPLFFARVAAHRSRHVDRVVDRPAAVAIIIR